MDETLEFVRECGTQWGVEIVWLEYLDHDEPKSRLTQASFEAASRAREPYQALIKRKNYLPNPVARFCTSALNIRA
ncbi:hypothetical protein [Reyranella sp.]|uniref:hypothetical protein n=1 Tax=Reyranella sp. TaxID=1929291 RepID=UPI003BA8FDA4